MSGTAKTPLYPFQYRQSAVLSIPIPPGLSFVVLLMAQKQMGRLDICENEIIFWDLYCPSE